MGDDICYWHLLTRTVFDGDIIVMQVEQNSLEVGWSICQVPQLDLLEGLVEHSQQRMHSQKYVWNHSTP